MVSESLYYWDFIHKKPHLFNTFFIICTLLRNDYEKLHGQVNSLDLNVLDYYLETSTFDFSFYWVRESQCTRSCYWVEGTGERRCSQEVGWKNPQDLRRRTSPAESSKNPHH